MAAQGTTNTKQAKAPKKQTPTFLLELPLVTGPAQAKRLRAHLEVGRQFYNAPLSEGQRRLRQMRADPAWREARAIPRSQKQERATALCAHSTAFPNTPCMKRPPPCARVDHRGSADSWSGQRALCQDFRRPGLSSPGVRPCLAHSCAERAHATDSPGSPRPFEPMWLALPKSARSKKLF